jgi:hypothetical protein
MALPPSGQLSIGDIRTELGSSSGSLRALSALAGFSSPDAISEFYGYPGGYFYPAVPFINGFDFSVNSKYSNSGTAIDDLSTYNWDGTFVTGTGNGTPTTIDQYTATSPGYMTIPGDSAQKSIRLNDSMKFGGTSNYTIITWFRVSAFSSSFPGIVAAEGRVGSTPIGYAMYLRSTPDFSIIHTRYNASSGSSGNNILTWGSCSIPAFAYNTWYMSAVRFDGSVMSLRLYAGGSGYNASVSYPNPLSTSASWSAFLGLRYNNWFNGRIGYYAVYGSTLTEGMLDTVFTNTRGRYGV